MEHALERHSPEPRVERSGVGYVSVLDVDDFLDMVGVSTRVSSIANHRIYLIVLEKYWVIVKKKKGKEKYDRMSGRGKRTLT